MCRNKVQPNDGLKPYVPKVSLNPLQSNNVSKCKRHLTCTAPLDPYLQIQTFHIFLFPTDWKWNWLTTESLSNQFLDYWGATCLGQIRPGQCQNIVDFPINLTLKIQYLILTLKFIYCQTHTFSKISQIQLKDTTVIRRTVVWPMIGICVVNKKSNKAETRAMEYELLSKVLRAGWKYILGKYFLKIIFITYF